jgi:pyrroline-5-carboxylate reductase
MGRAIIGGLIAGGYDKTRLKIVEPDRTARTKLTADFGLQADAEFTSLDGIDIVLLAVKPQVMHSVVSVLGPAFAGKCPLVISIAAGITTAQLSGWLGGVAAIVRVMPNMPSLIGRGAAALFATAAVDSAGREAAQSILRSVGVAVWVDSEQQLDAVTALSGSGPAYFFLVLEILERIGVELGLEAGVARELSIETACGAALLARESDYSPQILREQVTSPGGTTERALAVLADGDLEGLLRKALVAATRRSQELAEASR